MSDKGDGDTHAQRWGGALRAARAWGQKTSEEAPVPSWIRGGGLS